MKLSEALSLRKDLLTRISQLEGRLQNNVTVRRVKNPQRSQKNCSQN